MDLEQYIEDLEREAHFRRIDASVTIGPRRRKVATRPDHCPNRSYNPAEPRHIGCLTELPRTHEDKPHCQNGNQIAYDRPFETVNLRPDAGIVDAFGELRPDQAGWVNVDSAPSPSSLVPDFSGFGSLQLAPRECTGSAIATPVSAQLEFSFVATPRLLFRSDWQWPRVSFDMPVPIPALVGVQMRLLI